MQIKIGQNKLSVLKKSFNEVEKNCFEKPDFGVGSICGFLNVREGEYIIEISGTRCTLYELLYKLSMHFDVELI